MSRLRENLVKEYHIDQLGYDCMGYTYDNFKELSTHHIIPKHDGGNSKRNNLCILNRFTSHNYIHLIEEYDYKVFIQISSYLMQEAKNKQIDIEQIKYIHELLQFFEYKYRDECNRNNDPIIKPEFKVKRLHL